MSEDAMTTPLPSRLRESAKALRGLSPCSEHSYELLDVVAWNIAAELAEAADALEAGPCNLTDEEVLQVILSCGPELQGRIALTYDSGPYEVTTPTLVALRLADAIQRKFREVNNAAPAAQVAQEGGGVATDGGKQQ